MVLFFQYVFFNWGTYTPWHTVMQPFWSSSRSLGEKKKQVSPHTHHLLPLHCSLLYVKRHYLREGSLTQHVTPSSLFLSSTTHTCSSPTWSMRNVMHKTIIYRARGWTCSGQVHHSHHTYREHIFIFINTVQKHKWSLAIRVVFIMPWKISQQWQTNPSLTL